VQLQIKSGLRRVWRETGTLQIGLSRRRGTVISGLTAADVPLIDRLRDGLDASAFEAADDGLEAARRRELVGLLTEAGVLVGTGVGRPVREQLGPAAERLVPDAAVWSLVHPDVGDGWGLLAARATRRVLICGAGRLGSTLASALAAAGVGELLISDQRRVTAGDLAPGGAGGPDVGRLREEAGVDAVRRIGGRAERGATERARAERARAERGRAERARSERAGADRGRGERTGAGRTRVGTVAGRAEPGPVDDRPDLVVLIEHGAADAAAAGRLVSADQPHLSVVIREDDIVVGPLVRPGSGPCLRCLDLHRGDRDPAWPSVLAQLLRPTSGTPQPEETAASILGAGLAALQVLAQLDGVAEPATAGATLEIELPDGLIARRSWPPHPACGCHWPPQTEPGPDRSTVGDDLVTTSYNQGGSADQRNDPSLAGARIGSPTRRMKR
jgi:bacteriocin biosynthesis cyclodehydratase domain-containing protein